MDARDGVLDGASGVPGLRALLYGRPSRRALRGQLARLLAPAARLGTCRLERAKFKPGRKLTGYFVVEVLEADRTVTRPVEVTWSRDQPGPGGLSDAEVAAEDAVRDGGALAPFSALGAEDGDFRVRVWPLDVTFPQLVPLASAGRVREILSEVTGVPQPEYRVTSVRYRPRQRHVLRYEPVGPDESGVIFAKLYRSGEAARAQRVAASVATRVERVRPDVTAVRPFPGSEPWDVLLYPRLQGAPLARLLWRTSAARQLATSGAVLRSLHEGTSEVDGELPEHDLPAELRSIARAAEHLAPLLPGAAARVGRILQRAGELGERLPPGPVGFAHGDFKTDHLWVAPRQVTLIDFDTCCRAEPALDVGKMLADLDFWYGVSGRAGVAAAQQQFLAGYGDLPAGAMDRVRLYEAVVLTKLTLRRLRTFGPAWESGTSALTARAEGLLAAVATGRGRRAGTKPAALAPA